MGLGYPDLGLGLQNIVFQKGQTAYLRRGIQRKYFQLVLLRVAEIRKVM
jgi:hypothetical protein